MDTAHDLLRRLRARSPSGFAIALHIQFTTPRYLFQAYDKDWLDLYSRQGMVMDDPTVAWAFAHTGTIRWSDLAHDDPRRVLARAAEHGLRYGLAVSLDDGGSRSMASFARGDREMTDLDIRAITTDLRALHLITLGTAFLSPELHETLHRMSIFLTHG